MSLLTARAGAMVANSAVRLVTKEVLIKPVFQPGYFY